MVGKEVYLLKNVKGKHFLSQKLVLVKYLIYLCIRNKKETVLTIKTHTIMEKYDYLSAVTADVKDYINDNVDFADYENADELKDKLQDELWTVDRVTGNGSGSYTFSTWEAEENICHNSELIAEVEEEWGKLKRDDPEGIDVAIRCYLLPQAIDAAVDELWEDKED